MIITHKIHTVFMVSFLMVSNFLSADNQDTCDQIQAQAAYVKQKEHVPNSWDKIGMLYLPSLINKEDKQKMLNQLNAIQAPSTNAYVQTRESDELKKALTPTATDYIKQILAYLANTDPSTTNLHEESSTIFDDTTYRDLNVFCGKDEAPDASFFNIINNTHTIAGQAALLDLLYNPLTDIEVLTTRQAAIKKLVNDEQLFTSIQDKLVAIKNAEHTLFIMLNELHFNLINKIADRFYLKSIFDIPVVSLVTNLPFISLIRNLDKLPYLKEINTAVCDELNNQQTVLEVARFNNIVSAMVGILAVFLGISAYLGYRAYQQYKLSNRYGAIANGIGAISSLAFTIVLVKEIYKTVFDQLTSENMLHDAIGTLACMTTALKDLQKIVAQHKELTTILPFKDFEQDATVEFKKLLVLLDDENFKQEATWTTLKGKMMAALKFLNTLKYEFIEPYLEAGKLDALMSAANVYKKFEAHPNARFHFANYEQQATPHLAINEFWNPFINPDIVVTNALGLGTKMAHRNMLITGPNAGGKSTTLKAMAFAVLMAQTFTIANADITLTPFTKVFTTLNVTDTTGKESLYQADKNRVKQVITTLEELKPDKFALLISDEMFNSTGASYGAALFYGTLNYVDQSLKNTLFAAATHFENLVELEPDTNGSVANFHVEEATRGANGKLQWTYKVTPGINKQNISFELAQEDGFNSRLLEAGKKLLQRHKPPVLGVVSAVA